MKHVLTITLSLLVISCSENNQTRVPVKYQQGPSKSKELGLIVQATAPESDLLAAKFAGKIRSISITENVYEIFGATPSEIKSVAPKATVEKNIMLQTPHPLRSLALESMANEESALPHCVETQQGPEVDIDILNISDIKQKNGLIEKGQTIKFQAAINAKELKLAWYLVLPRTKQISGPFSSSVNFDYEPKDLGIYEVGLLAQDKDGNCGLNIVSIGVTANSEYRRTQSAGSGLLPLDRLNISTEHLNKIRAQEAWKLSQGEGQVIAILDSGVNYNHPYINENILTNEKEIPNNNIDDDENGLIDDFVGWDFVQNDAHPYDDVGHGSHVAGIATAKTFGVAPNAKILPIKIINIDGSTDLATATAAIYYAVDRGATVINASFGGPSNSQQQSASAIAKAFTYAEKKGVVIVTAAGNSRQNTDLTPHLPAGLPNLNNISVAATDLFDALTPYSNFGMRSVKVAAPGGCCGKPIFSAKQENSSEELFWGAEGTSMAAPVVAGTVALIKSYRKKISLKDLNTVLLNSGTISNQLRGKVRSERVLNAIDALTYKLTTRSLKQQAR